MTKHMRSKRAGGPHPFQANATLRRLQATSVALLLWSLCGCAALHSLDGHNSDELSMTYRLPSRSPQRTIDLSLLRQNPPAEHLVDAGDILGIYIEGVLDNPEKSPPVYIPNDTNGDPSLGFPLRVDADGTISLPMLDPLYVRGLTVGQVRQLIRETYTQGDRAVLQPGQDHIHVTLQKPRNYQIIVIREESGNEQGNRGAAAVVNFETEKRGTGRIVNLPAHRNDVLNALTQTGGLPGLDAENVIYVIRGAKNTADCECQTGDGVPAEPSIEPIPAARRGRDSNIIQTAAWQTKKDARSRAARVGGHSVTQAHYTPNGSTDFASSLYPEARAAQKNGIQKVSHRYRAPLLERPTSTVRTLNQNGINMVRPVSSHAGMTPGGLQLPPAIASLPQSPGMSPATSMQATAMQPPATMQTVDAAAGAMTPCNQCLVNGTPNIIRIPMKVLPGEPLSFRPEDVVLNDGDIVLVENRVTEFFYTAGLLGGGQYVIPRDYDIGVMDAIALAESQTRQDLPTSTIGGASVLNQDVSVGASRVIIQRKMANGSYFPIEINLYDMLKDPSQQVMIRPEDRVILRYTRCEAALAFFERFFIDGIVTGVAGALTFNN